MQDAVSVNDDICLSVVADLSWDSVHRGGGGAMAELHLPLHKNEVQPARLRHQTRLPGGV